MGSYCEFPQMWQQQQSGFCENVYLHRLLEEYYLPCNKRPKFSLSLLDWDGGFPSALAGAAGLPAHPSPLPSSASSEAASGSNLAAIFQTGVRRMRLRQLMGGRGEHARAGKFCSAHACGAVCSLAQDEGKGVSASLWLSDMRL